MSTAVEEKDTAAETGELLVQSKPNVMFRSARKNLRLTMEARYPIMNPVTHRPSGVTKGKFVAFRETAKGGLLTFAEKGPVKLIDKLNLLIEQEEQGWGRSELLDTARGAVERIVAAKAKVAAEAGATPDDPEPGAE
jgi:hypothetical protein